MKKMKENKKMMLNKETVSDLRMEQMLDVKGGAQWETITEPSIDIREC